MNGPKLTRRWPSIAPNPVRFLLAYQRTWCTVLGGIKLRLAQNPRYVHGHFPEFRSAYGL
jgi:hypothetical protein